MTNAPSRSPFQLSCNIILGTEARPALWNPGRQGCLQVRESTGQGAFAQLKRVAEASVLAQQLCPFTDDVNYTVRLHTVSPTATFQDKL